MSKQNIPVTEAPVTSSGRNPQAHFSPFDWQIEGRRPNHVSRWTPGYVPTEEEVEAAESDAFATHGQRAPKSTTK